MRMKPKSTVHNPRALLYKRFTDVETSEAFRAIYRTENDGDIAFWVFNAETAKFERANGLLAGEYKTLVNVDENTLYRFNNYVYRWTVTAFEDHTPLYAWERYDLSSVTPDGTPVELDIYIGDIGSAGVFMGTINIPDLITDAPESVTIYQASGEDMLAVYARIFLGSKFYNYGYWDESVSDPTFKVDTGTEKTFYFPREVSAPYDAKKIEVGGEILGAANDIVVTVKFTTVGLDLLSVKFNNIAKYQTNKYYYAGSFDYMIRGTIGQMDTQYIKGNILHLRSFEIKYFNDYINLDHDDLVVIDGHLYVVGETPYDEKRSPKPYRVYFATLNNIL